MKKIIFLAAILCCSLAPSLSKANHSAVNTLSVSEVYTEAAPPVQLVGAVYTATPCNTQDGFINLRQYPSAKSRSLKKLYVGEYFSVRKVRNSKFYAVLNYNGGVKGYVNGDYICFP